MKDNVSESEKEALLGTPLKLQEVTPSDSPDAPSLSDKTVDGVLLKLEVELGRISMTLDDVRKMKVGSAYELGRLIGEPVDIMVNGYPVAKGDIVAVDEFYGVRVTKILTPEEAKLLKNHIEV